MSPVHRRAHPRACRERRRHRLRLPPPPRRCSSIPARLSTAGLPPPPPRIRGSETMMGDLYDDEEGDEYEGGLPRKSPARPPRAPPPPPPPRARPPPPPPPPPPATAGRRLASPLSPHLRRHLLCVSRRWSMGRSPPRLRPSCAHASRARRQNVQLRGRASVLPAPPPRYRPTASLVKKNPTQLFWQVPIDSVASAERGRLVESF